MAPLLIAMQLIALHRLDGGELFVNPAQIAFVAEPRKKPDTTTLNPATRCVVFMTDRHFINVLETCAAVKQLLER